MKAHLAALVVSAPLLAAAHGGGLNAEGCHTNRKTGDYHCHGGRASAPAPSQQRQQQLAEPPARERQTSSGQTCYTGPRGGTYTITKSGRKNYAGC